MTADSRYWRAPSTVVRAGASWAPTGAFNTDSVPDASTAPVGQHLHLASSSSRVHTRVASAAPAGTQP